MKDSKGHGSNPGRVAGGGFTAPPSRGGFIPHTVPTNSQPGDLPPGCGIILDRGQYKRTVPGTGAACAIADADTPGGGQGTLAEVSAEGATTAKVEGTS
jgi:hypothetical protein